MLIFEYKCFQETLDFAEKLGWNEPKIDGAWTPDCADSLEESAIDYIASHGYDIY